MQAVADEGREECIEEEKGKEDQVDEMGEGEFEVFFER